MGQEGCGAYWRGGSWPRESRRGFWLASWHEDNRTKTMTTEATHTAYRRRALSALRRFVAREGHARVPFRHSEHGFPLGLWVARRRHDGKAGRLARGLEAIFEALPGWTWDVYADAFERGLDVLRRFTEREGHCAVPQAHREAGFALGDWVSCRRQDRRLGRLAAARAEALEAPPGWTWSGHGRYGYGDERALRALERFARRTGNTSIPPEYREAGVSLGRRVRRWRRARGAGDLDPRLARELEALPGWTWNDAWADAFERGLERLQRYVSREGHARVPVAHEEAGYNLGAWVAFKRRDHKKGRLPDYQVKALQALPGWTWNARRKVISPSVARQHRDGRSVSR